MWFIGFLVLICIYACWVLHVTNKSATRINGK